MAPVDNGHDTTVLDQRGPAARMFFVQGSANRQLAGRVVGATDALIAVEIDDAGAVLPEAGDSIHLVVDGRLLHTLIHRVDDRMVTVVCPEGVELRDVPAALPARAGFATTWRDATGAPLAAWVLELSVRGTRILAVRGDHLRAGERVHIDLDGHSVRCRVASVAAHRHHEHAIYQLEFDQADGHATTPVVRLRGALRSTAPHRTAHYRLVAA